MIDEKKIAVLDYKNKEGKIEKVEGDYEIKPPENAEKFELDL